MVKFSKDPIYRTKVIVRKPVRTPAIPNHTIRPVSRRAYKKPDKDVTDNRDAILKEISSDDDNAGSNYEPVEVVDNKAVVSGTVGPQETVKVS